MSMKELAQHVLAVGHQNGMTVTNLQLQKVMYFTIKDYVTHNGIDDFIKEMYDKPFEAWPYGPVERNIYFEYNGYGSMNISESGKICDNYNRLNDSIRYYLKEPVFELVAKSHKEHFWESHKEAIMKRDRVEYELKDIKANG